MATPQSAKEASKEEPESAKKGFLSRFFGGKGKGESRLVAVASLGRMGGAEAKSALTRANNELLEKERTLARQNVELQAKGLEIKALNVTVDEQKIFDVTVPIGMPRCSEISW